MKDSKWILKSNTFWVNVLGILVEAGLLATDTFKTNPKVTIYVGFAVGVANIILRKITTKPVTFLPENKE